MIANPSGIFAVYSMREVFEFDRFWAIGSGRDFALGRDVRDLPSARRPPPPSRRRGRRRAPSSTPAPRRPSRCTRSRARVRAVRCASTSGSGRRASSRRARSRRRRSPAGTSAVEGERAKPARRLRVGDRVVGAPPALRARRRREGALGAARAGARGRRAVRGDRGEPRQRRRARRAAEGAAAAALPGPADEEDAARLRALAAPRRRGVSPR